MARARTTAAPWLTTCAWAIWSPGQPPDPADAALSRRWDAWHEAVGWWRQARDLEDLAEQRWLHVLGRAAAPDESDSAEPEDAGPHHHHHDPDHHGGRHQPPAPGTDPPVGPIDDDEPVGPVLVTVAVTARSRRTITTRPGPSASPSRTPTTRRGEAKAEPVPVNLPMNLHESWAAGAGLGSAGLLGGAGGRDPITQPEPSDPGPRGAEGAVRRPACR